MHSSTIAACGLAALCLLAGCGGGTTGPTVSTPPIQPTVESSTVTQTEMATPYDLSVADSDQGRTLLSNLEGRGLPVESVRTDNGSVLVRYQAINGTRQQAQESFLLGLAYGDVVNQTWTSTATWNASRLDAVALDESGAPVSRFRMPAYWGRQAALDTDRMGRLGSRLANASENASADGTFPVPDASVRAFHNASAETTTVTEFDKVGRTVFLTARTDTGAETLPGTLTDLAAAYGSDSGNTTALEVTIRTSSGELFGWYRVTAADAAAVADGDSSVEMAAVVRENDRLEPN